jgi:CheY-like chemotaxis protein
MTSPLAVLCYEKLLPGSQMVTRLEDMAYRVKVLNDSSQLAEVAQRSKPMVVLVDMVSRDHDVATAITSLRAGAETSHIPVLAFAALDNESGQEAARSAGANMVASEEAILNQLPSLLNHVLELKE